MFFCELVPILLETVRFFNSFKKQSILFINCKTVPLVSIIADWSNFKSKATQATLRPHVTTSLVRIHTWQPIKGQLLCKVPADPFITRHITKTGFSFSLLAIRIKTENSSRRKNKCINPSFPEPKIHHKLINSQRFIDESSSLN